MDGLANRGGTGRDGPSSGIGQVFGQYGVGFPAGGIAIISLWLGIGSFYWKMLGLWCKYISALRQQTTDHYALRPPMTSSKMTMIAITSST